MGLSHIGIWPENWRSAVAALRPRGGMVADPRTGSTKTSITNVTDPNGVRLELVDFRLARCQGKPWTNTNSTRCFLTVSIFLLLSNYGSRQGKNMR